ncbi:GNAT family N-acetyltransferase [Sulfitobacter alexandrii]|uniref:GNAT family N-acetyltransferase n=1 Tax=Sulfitobacter alexandrii TaxID=1917485 RepID=A0A1J0WLX9_9RHOB|nr:GNAT family N-acetyltransferase [Sulfitobacter alexandrii]APE45385.1 GNAT family N-acetyltransferase [Sulfitobacter alexandrii]
MQMETITNQPLIATPRFDLRPLRRSDKGLIEFFAGDPRVALTTATIPHPLPPGTIEAFIARALADPRVEDVWAMDGLKTGGSEVMGVISLTRLDRNQSEIGYWVAPAYWNSHLASEAVQALVSANPQGNAAMFASVFHDNPASAKVLTNAGFVYLGDAETYCVARQAAVPTWTYSRKL